MFMNKPEPPDGQAYLETDKGIRWICCPFCGKKQFPLTDGAIIKGQMFRCKGSNCKRDYEVNM